MFGTTVGNIQNRMFGTQQREIYKIECLVHNSGKYTK